MAGYRLKPEVSNWIWHAFKMIMKSPSSYKFKNIISNGFIISLGVLFCIEIYALTWEISQPIKQLRKVKVKIIESYRMHNDLHWTSKEYRLYLAGMAEPVDFPLRNYDNSIKVGDVVDVTIRKSFSCFGLKDEFDGITIIISPQIKSGTDSI